MNTGIYRLGMGILVGCMIGFLAFESFALFLFALPAPVGGNSHQVLISGATYGCISGAMFGPALIVLRLGWKPASILTGITMGIYHILHLSLKMMSTPMFPSFAAAIPFLLQGTLYFFFSGAFAGAMVPLVSEKLIQWLSVFNHSRPRHEDREDHIYRLG